LASKRHDCPWRSEAGELRGKLTERDAEVTRLTEQVATLLSRVDKMEHKLALATKQVVGPKSERMPTPEEEAKKKEGHKPARGGYTNPKKRKENAEALARIPATVVPHPIPDDERRCPHCGDEVRPIGKGDESTEYEWVPGRLERRVHVVEVGRCPCKLHYARGPAPARVKEGCLYGPAFLAKLAIEKCADATPIYRVEKAMRRAGIPISRSTLNDLLLCAADVLEPLWDVALGHMRCDPHVQADETSMRVQTRTQRAFVWTFLSQQYTLYVFSPSRSGDTPKNILGGTLGSLTVDGYTGYNVVTDVDGRDRSGCWSHARRHLFDALPRAPEARRGLDIILDLFMIERAAARQNILGTAAHLALRKRKSAKVVARLRVWRDETAPLFEPNSAMGEALRYLDNQWERLIAFLDDPLIPIHNNASEAALRIIALLRKNSLFFGNDEAGRRLMVLYSLLAMCEQHDVNPEVYLADVLLRIQDHTKDALVELLPHRWKLAYGSGFTVDRIVAPVEAT